MRLCLSCGCPFVAVEWRCPECGAEPAVVDGVTMFAPDLAAEGEGFDPELFDTLAALEPHSFWFRARNRLIAWAVTEYFPSASTFLEVGCGTGFVLAGLQDAAPRLSLSGSELFPQAFEYARRRAPNATLYQLDARQIPFVDEWDVIGAFDVLEHIEDDAAALQSIRRALHDGGGLLVTVPQHPQLWSTADEYAHHVRRYRRGELRNKLELAGFRVARMTSFVTLLLPAMALMRYRGRKRSLQAYDPTGEHRVGRLTPVLEGTLEVERMAIRRGWSLPAGGSLLAIAVTDGR